MTRRLLDVGRPSGWERAAGWLFALLIVALILIGLGVLS